VWNVSATTNAVTELADHLICQGIERVVLESTSDYWRIWFYLLEARGLPVWLVNANQVKQVPGRPKTDKLDAVWLAKLTEKGLLRASFVPPPEIRVLRDYTRTRIDLTGERVDLVQEHAGDFGVVVVEVPVERLDQRRVLDLHSSAGQTG